MKWYTEEEDIEVETDGIIDRKRYKKQKIHLYDRKIALKKVTQIF